jgi:hypothetical protein
VKPTPLATAIVTLALLAPRVSEACAVCTAGRDDDTQRAFLLGTLILTSLPFVLIGGIVGWLWRRIRRSEAEVIQTSSAP